MAPASRRKFGRRVQNEAAAWHVRMLEPASRAEVAAFEKWLAADPVHAEAYASMQSISSIAEGLPRGMLFDPSFHSSSPLRPAWGFAAAILFLLVAGGWLVSRGTQPAYAAITNPGPSVRGVRLTDGTGVILDSGARLVVAFNDHARIVTVEAGRVRFNVAVDDRRPFSVEAPAARVAAGHALFDIAVHGREARIYLLKGEAAIEPSGVGSSAAPMRVRPGQAIHARNGKLTGTLIQSGEARWPASRVGFEDTPLATIAAIANRGDGPDIQVQDEAVGALKVTGVLDLRDTKDLANKLAAALDLEVREHGRTILIAR